MINLDCNATHPLRPEAWQAMQPWMTTSPGNPASVHALGRQARRALEDARELVAHQLGAHPDEVIFTSGATEANNLALFGLAGDLPGHFISSRIEHPCVVEPLEQIAKTLGPISWLSVTLEGQVTPETLTTTVRADTRLAAIMLANHETGSIQPISSLRQALGDDKIFHCDAAQAVGKIPVHFHDFGVSTLSVSGHKFGGPVGIGALLVNRCIPLHPRSFGGHQQRGRRPGTEPVALAAGMAAALDAALNDLENSTIRMRNLRSRFLNLLERDAAPVILNGPMSGGLAHVMNLSFPGCRADALVMALDLAGVACSTGSACSSGSLLPSPVLRAMGLSEDRLNSALRFSFGHSLTEPEIDEAGRRVARTVKRLREIQAET